MKKKNRQLVNLTAFILLMILAASCSPAGTTPAATASPSSEEPITSTEPTDTVTDEAEEATGEIPAEATLPGTEETAAPIAAESVSCDLDLPSEEDWPVTLCETFDDNSNDWQIESQDNPYAGYSIDIVNGKYELDYTAKGFAQFQQSALTWFNVSSADDFAMSVTTLMNSDYQSPSWGVAFRGDEDSFFLFSIYNDATYAFEIYEDDTWIPLISRRGYDGIQINAENKLTILAEGGDFTFSINDEFVSTFNGGLLTGTDVLLVASAGEGASADYYFDDLVMQTSP